MNFFERVKIAANSIDHSEPVKATSHIDENAR